MGELAHGTKVFDHAPVRGTWKAMEGPEDVLELMDDGAEGVIVLVRDAEFSDPLLRRPVAGQG